MKLRIIEISIFLVIIALAIGAGVFVAREVNVYTDSIEDIYGLDEGNSASSVQSFQRLKRPVESQILLLGDIMMARSVYAKIRDAGGGDFTYPFWLIQDTLHEAGYVFANSEGAISERGSNQGSKYSFRFDPRSAQAMKDSGIDIVSLANNHIWDWGRVALCDTIEHLRQANVATVGAGCTESEANQPHIAIVDDTTIAFLAYTNLYPPSLVAQGDTPGISNFAQESILEAIRHLSVSDDIDLIFVSFHWGTEYKTQSNGEQQALARAMIDAGADIIIGHHPHVAQELERYQNGWIFYSLGNFIFDQYFSEETMKGIIADVRVEEGTIVEVNTIPYQLTETYQPYLVTQDTQSDVSG